MVMCPHPSEYGVLTYSLTCLMEQVMVFKELSDVSRTCIVFYSELVLIFVYIQEGNGIVIVNNHID
jgi:hypothetical protein